MSVSAPVGKMASGTLGAATMGVAVFAGVEEAVSGEVSVALQLHFVLSSDSMDTHDSGYDDRWC
ncbi:hypothetical protein, partial [Gluconobacter kondonii]|uniref:hypothetical protein n=1 Tax=Gluconobacter kondonii TaxID=941463 RepID=UPI001B8BFF7B